MLSCVGVQNLLVICSNIFGNVTAYRFFGIYCLHRIESLTARLRFDDPNAEPINEEDDYITARYMCATDAINRIFRFQTCYMSPAVITLPVHLKNQNVAAYNNAGSNASLLLRWLKMRPAECERMTYKEYYEAIVINNNQDEPNEGYREIAYNNVPRRYMSVRVQREKIAYMTSIMPQRGEVYYLRILLDEGVIGRTWTDLRTVDGNVFPTYQAAAVAMGLFDDAVEAERTMREAVELFRTPAQLRFMFIQLILDGIAPAQPLYGQFEASLQADYRHRFAEDPLRVRRMILEDFQRMLRQHGRTLADFGFEELDQEAIRIQEENDFWRPRLDELRLQTDRGRLMINVEQQRFLAQIEADIAAALNGGPASIRFLEGKGIP